MPKGIYFHKPENYPPSRKEVRLTDEHKRKIKERLKGNTWNKGRKHSKESSQLKSLNSARYWLGKTGKNHAHWKNSKKNPLYLQIRQCFQYRQWRWDVYTRDNFTCVLCGRKKEVSGILEADHFPKQFIEILAEYQVKTFDDAVNCEELWNINNGRTLCKDCHNPTRGRGRRYKM